MSKGKKGGIREVWVLFLIPLIGGAAVGVVIALASRTKSVDVFSDGLKRPPSPGKFGTNAEIGTRGDKGNPGALYRGEYPSDGDTQERAIGDMPARFSGYTTWVRSVARVKAKTLVDGYDGDYVKAHVTIFNRDTKTQHVCACDFFVWSPTAGEREADAVGAPTVAPFRTMHSGEKLNGDVYLYVGNVRGPLFLVYRPDDHVSYSSSQSRGVWRIG
jgi:hypothetical protein